ncbi:class I SAM-dependent methyltransferase [Leifsonia sp. SIMBA_070]|uniref:class I SAM-dependent methyltransferase n=1 Tax=Leifsonia sp. SIMBA_070 TaxID=3085810 RepID=UPI00397E3689
MTDDEHVRMVRERFDDRAPTYDDSAMHRGLAAAVAAFIDLTDVEAMLDIATGTGLVLRALRDRGFDGPLTGVDLSPRMIDEARRHLPDAELLAADATSLPFPDASFDLVTCVTGLQLFPHPDAAIREWSRVLRPGGRAVTATFLSVDPTRHGGAPSPGSAAGSTPGSAPGSSNHIPFASVERLAETVGPAGFTIARSETWRDGADELLIAELTASTR